jgi:DNA-directed RNA polymerase specialized sigma subunit
MKYNIYRRFYGIYYFTHMGSLAGTHGPLPWLVGKDIYHERLSVGKTIQEKREARYYLTNKDFLAELVEYKKTLIVSDKLGGMFKELAEKVGNRANFYRYTYRDDMIAEGVLTCIKYMDNFDPEKSKNPFSYFTTIIYHSFQAFINKEKKQSKIKEKIRRVIDDGHRREMPKRMKWAEDNQ